MDEAKTLKRNLIYNTVGNVIYFACQWLVTGFFIKVLSPLGAGELNAGYLATAMTVTNIFLTLASYGMRTYQVSDVDERYSSGDYIMSRVITVTAAIALCFLYSVIVGYAGVQLWCIFLFLLYKLLEAVTDVFHGFCQKHERMDIIGISYAVRGILSLVVFCVLFKATGNLNLTLGAMVLLCYAFSAGYDVINTKRFYLPVKPTDRSSVWRLLYECLPLAVYVFLNTTTASIPKLFFERMAGTEAMGIYGLVNSPVLILQVGVAFLFAPFITTFANKLKDRDYKGFIRLSAFITLGVFAVGLVGLGGVLLIGKWGLSFLYGSEIAAHSALLVPMVVCTVFTSLALFYCMLLTVLREMKGLILSTLFGIVVSLAISVPFISGFSFFGVTYATIIALVVECVALAYFGITSLNKKEK